MTDDKNCSNCGKEGTWGGVIDLTKQTVTWWCKECKVCEDDEEDNKPKQCDKCGKVCEKDNWFICGGDCGELFCIDCDKALNPHASGKCKVCEDDEEDEEDEEIDCRYCGAEASVPCDETKCPFRICNRIDREQNKQ